MKILLVGRESPRALRSPAGCLAQLLAYMLNMFAVIHKTYRVHLDGRAHRLALRVVRYGAQSQQQNPAEPRGG